jgi:hypothetical protein
VTKAQIIKTIEVDFKELPLWPFSAYAYDKGVPTTMPGDISFEELRLQSYADLKQTGNYNATVHALSQCFGCCLFTSLVCTNANALSFA